MQEADKVVVLDTGSTDKTVEILRSLGAEVSVKEISPWRFDVARNASLDLVPEDIDICVCTDLDEVFHPGWREKLEAAWGDDVGQGKYRYTWSFLPDGKEGVVFWGEKIHKRKGYLWVHPVHEVLRYKGTEAEGKRVNIEGVQLDHYPDPKKSRGQYLPLLELSVREEPEDDRNMHYLGREYMFYGRHADCIETLKRHLSMKTALWQDERCASMRYIARSYWALGNEEEAEKWFLRSVAEAPYLREPWLDYAKFALARQEWELVLWLSLRALQIRHRAQSYINEAESFGSLPYDLASLGFYYTGRYKKALSYVEEAIRLSPDDERLRQNKIWMEKALS